MKTFQKILIAGTAGTFLMTVYLKMQSSEKQEYLPPVLLNKSIDNTENLPDVKDTKVNPRGWILHWLTGIGFMTAYHFFGKQTLAKPNLKRLGEASILNASIGVFIWNQLLKKHPCPPDVNPPSYFKHLFTGHVIFTAVSLFTYKFLTKNQIKN